MGSGSVGSQRSENLMHRPLQHWSSRRHGLGLRSVMQAQRRCPFRCRAACFEQHLVQAGCWCRLAFGPLPLPFRRRPHFVPIGLQVSLLKSSAVDSFASTTPGARTETRPAAVMRSASRRLRPVLNVLVSLSNAALSMTVSPILLARRREWRCPAVTTASR